MFDAETTIVLWQNYLGRLWYEPFQVRVLKSTTWLQDKCLCVQVVCVRAPEGPMALYFFP